MPRRKSHREADQDRDELLDKEPDDGFVADLADQFKDARMEDGARNERQIGKALLRSGFISEYRS